MVSYFFRALYKSCRTATYFPGVNGAGGEIESNSRLDVIHTEKAGIKGILNYTAHS